MILTDEDKVYTAAYGLYQLGDYQEALPLFLRLTLDNPFNDSHWRGLASTHQMLSQFRESVQAWSVIALLCDNDPYPHFHAAECLLSLGEIEDGYKALDCASERIVHSDHELIGKIEVLKKIA